MSFVGSMLNKSRVW